MKYLLSILLFCIVQNASSQVSISIDKNGLEKENVVLLIKCEIPQTIVFCQEGEEKQRKNFKGSKYFEISNKYELLQILESADLETTYINLTNKLGLLSRSKLLNNKKEKDIIYL